MAEAFTQASDKKAYVSEVQRYLRAIAYYDERISLVAIDGVYDSKTSAAVGAFQTAYNLPVTGSVDKETFDKIYEAYTQFLREQSPAEKIVGFPQTDEVILPGDTGPEVYFLQIMLKTLADRFDNVYSVDINGRYDNATREAVDTVKRAAKINGDVMGTDKQTFDAITHLYNNTVNSK